jgi:hypothetical protein
VSRRRRRARRRAEAPERAQSADRRGGRALEKRRADFVAQQRAISRRRTIIGALALVPLAGVVGCIFGVELLCMVPREWWFGIWAALAGSYLGLTIRLVLERRKFQRETASERSA